MAGGIDSTYPISEARPVRLSAEDGCWPMPAGDETVQPSARRRRMGLRQEGFFRRMVDAVTHPALYLWTAVAAVAAGVYKLIELAAHLL